MMENQINPDEGTCDHNIESSSNKHANSKQLKRRHQHKLKKTVSVDVTALTASDVFLHDSFTFHAN